MTINFSEQFDAFHEQAIKLSGGISDFGSDDYKDPMRLLLHDYDKHARLSETGRQMMAGSVIGDLIGRLYEESGFQKYPQYATAQIKRPIFIIGMARTGTTVLHRLMSADPNLQSYPMWLAASPMPRPPRSTWKSFPEYQRTQAGLDWLKAASPQWFKLHPQTAASADECRLIVNHTFRGPSLAVSAHIPEFEEWVNQVDMVGPYQRHKKVLGLIAGGDKRQWLLKCPSHLWWLDVLTKIYPDACLVMTHRDPITSIPSLFGLVWSVRPLLEAGATRERYGRENIDMWEWVLNKVEKDRVNIPSSQIFDIHCDDVRADPIGSLERIYTHFEIPLTEEARTAWQRQICSDPDGGHVSQRITAEDFGLTNTEIINAMGPYYDRYKQVENGRHVSVDKNHN